MNKKKAKEVLLNLIEKTDKKIYTVLKYTSTIDTYKMIKLYVIVDNKIIDITYNTGILVGGLVLRNDNYYIEGSDELLAKHIINNLSNYLYKNKYELEQIEL